MAPSKGILLHLATKLALETSRKLSGSHHGWLSCCFLRAEQFHRSAEVYDVGSKEEGGATTSSGDTALASRGPYASRLGMGALPRYGGPLAKDSDNELSEAGGIGWGAGEGSLKVDKVLELLKTQPSVPKSAVTVQQRPRRKNQVYERSQHITAVSNLVTLLEGAETTGDVEKLLNDKAVELIGLEAWPWLPLFDALQKGPKPHLVIEVFHWRRRQLSKAPDPKEYAKMISCAGKLNQLEMAEQLFDEMKSHGLKHTAATHNALIFAFGRNFQPDKAVALFKEMKETEDCQPTLITYNTLISMYSRLSVIGEMEKVFQACKAAGFSPDRHTYNALIWGLMRGGQYSKMEDMFNELQRSECRPDIITFNALFIAYSRMEALDKMEETFKAMQKAGLPINALIGEILVEAYGKKLGYAKMEGVIRIMDDTPNVMPGARIYGLLIEAYAAGGRLNEMERVLDKMLLANRLFSTPKTLEAVITAFSTAGEYDRLQKVLDRVKISGWMMSSISYNTLIFEYGRGGLLSKMEQAYEQMRAGGVEITQKTFQIMYDAFEKLKDTRGKERTRQRMMQAGFDPFKDLDVTFDRAYSDEEIYGGKVRPITPSR